MNPTAHQRFVLLPFLMASAFAVETVAAPPQVNGITPFGFQRGVAVELTIGGANLGDHPRLLAPFTIVSAETVPGSNGGGWKVKVVAAPNTAVGVYPVRVQTDEGPSNPWLLAVGQLPQVAEKEDNSEFALAQPFNAPAVIEGQSAGNDVDYFRFPGKKGQKVVIDAQCARIGSGVDPSIRLTTMNHVYVASADDTAGLQTDARIVAVLPEDTDYVIELSDTRYAGGGRPIYRLLVGALPVADEVYPMGGRLGETVGLEFRGGTLDGLPVAASTVRDAAGIGVDRVRALIDSPFEVESMPPLLVGQYPELREPADPAAPPTRGAAPLVFNGRIDPPGDEDRFALAVVPGQRLRVEVDASEIGSALDGVLQILGPNNSVIANNDDTTSPDPAQPQNNALRLTSADPSLEFTVPAGLNEVTLALRDLEGRGGIGFPYRITVAPVGPDFDLVLNQTQVAVPKGGTATIGVTVVRKAGFNSAIDLNVANPPAGLTVRPGRINEGQTLGLFSVSGSPDAAFPAVTLAVTGSGTSSGVSVSRTASKKIVFAQQANVPTNTVVQNGLVAAPAMAVPVSLDVPTAKVEVVQGYPATFAVKATRSAGADAALDLTPVAPLPPGLAVPNAKLAEKAAETNVTVTTTTDLPIGAFTFGLSAKGKLGGADRVVGVPAVLLDVVRPASVELATAALEIKPGATVELKGKVVRRGPFKEPVTARIDGLPAGVKAEPVKVAPEASEFTLKLTADPKAAPAAAGGNVALAFQVNKKDYPAPTAPLSVKVVPAK